MSHKPRGAKQRGGGTELTPSKAAILVDKNARTMVKLSQLLAIYNKPGASDLDVNGRVAARIELYKRRIARRLQKLANFVDTPEIERPRERAPLLRLPIKKESSGKRPRPYRYRPRNHRPIPNTLSSSSEAQSQMRQSGQIGMTAESERQYTFGWKRYVDFCEQFNLDPLCQSKDNPSTPSQQVLQFARYLMEHPEKAVRPAAASSYVSAVGKKLMDAKVIDSMRDIRTQEMKEYFIVSNEMQKRQSIGGTERRDQGHFPNDSNPGIFNNIGMIRNPISNTSAVDVSFRQSFSNSTTQPEIQSLSNTTANPTGS